MMKTSHQLSNIYWISDLHSYRVLSETLNTLICREILVIAQTEGIVRSPNTADSCASRIGSATPQKPSEHRDTGLENGLHAAINMYGRMDDISTPKEAHAYAAFLRQETRKRSDPERCAEVLRPFKKIREGEAIESREGEAMESPTHMKACPARRLSIGSTKDTESVHSFPTTECEERPEHKKAAEELTVVQTEPDEDPLPPQDIKLPFIKSSKLWDAFESFETFRLMPQKPHFLPLQKYDEILREGFAIGSMLNFDGLVERISKAKFDEPLSMLERKLKALSDLEELGFSVQLIEVRLKELLRLKTSCHQLDDRLAKAERVLSQEKCKIDELEESITQLKMKIQKLMLEKELTGLYVAEEQKNADAIKERILAARLEFESMVASPWIPQRSCTGIVNGDPTGDLGVTAEKMEDSEVQLPKQVPPPDGLLQIRRSNRIKKKTQLKDRKGPEKIDVDSIDIPETNKTEMLGPTTSMIYEPPHRDLKPDEVIIFNWIYSRDADQQEIILDLQDSYASRSQFYCMLGQAWVLNVIVDNWVSYLNHLQKKDTLKHHYFPIIYMDKIYSGDFGEKHFNGYLRKLEYPLQKCERFFFPTQRGRHWLLYVAEPKEKKIAVLDSLKEKQALDYNLKRNIIRFLEYTKVLTSGASDWHMYHVTEDLPLQENGDDCGIFVMKYMQYWNGKELECKFSQADIPLFRHQIPVDMMKFQIMEINGQSISAFVSG